MDFRVITAVFPSPGHVPHTGIRFEFVITFSKLLAFFGGRPCLTGLPFRTLGFELRHFFGSFHKKGTNTVAKTKTPCKAIQVPGISAQMPNL